MTGSHILKVSDIDERTDLDSLDVYAATHAMPMEKCRKHFRTSAKRAHDKVAVTVSTRPVTLPKLKFLEGKDP